MEKLDTSLKKIVERIKTQTGQNPDIINRDLRVHGTEISVVFSESLTDRVVINDYILEYFEELNQSSQKINNIFEHIKSNLPTHKVIDITTYKDLFYNIFSGFTLVIVNGSDTILSIETRGKLYSDVTPAENEQVTKGPRDAFTENYQTNLGLIRKRIKSETLWLEESVIGSIGKTKVGLYYMKDIASKELVDQVKSKLNSIEIDDIFDSNYLIESISNDKKNVFPIYISTERPDLVSMHLLEGRIALVVENTPYVIIVPALLVDFFHSPEDFYQKVTNVNFTRIIRVIAFLISVLAPAIYVAMSTYNIEAIPAKLLLNFSAQRAGVPLPTVLEILMMMVTFEILRESDTRLPSAIGSSLSIVGALVLGQAAVAAGIVSAITIIVAAVTAISGLICASIDVVNGVRWWRLIFLLFAAFAGIYGIVVAGYIFLINVASIKSFGLPYATPIAPLFIKEHNNAIFITNQRKFNKRSQLTAKANTERQAK